MLEKILGPQFGHIGTNVSQRLVTFNFAIIVAPGVGRFVFVPETMADHGLGDNLIPFNLFGAIYLLGS